MGVEKIKAFMRRAPTIHHSKKIITPYKDKGFAQRVAKSRLFEYITLAVIGINSLWIWLDVDLNTPGSVHYNSVPDDFRWIFKVADNLFCVFYTFEITVF